MPYNDFRSDIPSHASVIGCNYEGADYSPEAQFDNILILKAELKRRLLVRQYVSWVNQSSVTRFVFDSALQLITLL